MATELAKLIIKDGQPVRVMEGYFNQTFADLKGLKIVSHIDFKPSEDPAEMAANSVYNPYQLSVIEYLENLEAAIHFSKNYLMETMSEEN